MRVDELHDDPLGLMHFALAQLTGKQLEDHGDLDDFDHLDDLDDMNEIEDLEEFRKSNFASLPSDLMLPYHHSPGQRVGRNEPCPRGSGKKFKK